LLTTLIYILLLRCSGKRGVTIVVGFLIVEAFVLRILFEDER